MYALMKSSHFSLKSSFQLHLTIPCYISKIITFFFRKQRNEKYTKGMNDLEVIILFEMKAQKDNNFIRMQLDYECH